MFWPFLNRGGIIEQELELGSKKTNFNTLKTYSAENQG